MSDATLEHDAAAHAAGGHHHSAEEEARSIDNQKFAMWLFLASDLITFAVLIAVYILFRQHNAEIVSAVHSELGFGGILLVTFNTFLLLTSSWAMVMGLRQIQRDNKQGLIRWLGVTAALGTAFVLLQYYEYNQLSEMGVILAASRDNFDGFGMRFYAPTAFHGAHVIIGVLWCLWVMWRAQKGAYSSRNNVGVEVFGLYWHFVDVVWIMLFTIIYLI